MPRKSLFLLFFLLPSLVVGQAGATQAEAERILSPLKLDNPRDTMKSFMEAMNNYKTGVESKDENLIVQLDKAARTFDLKETPAVLKLEVGRETAIYLKEVIDRAIKIDYSKIPEDNRNYWRLKGTDIAIVKMTEGEFKDRYLFSSDTAYRAKEFYNKVKHLDYIPGTGQGAHFKTPWIDKFLPKWAGEKVILLPNWQWAAILLSIFLGMFLSRVSRWVVRGFTKLTDRDSLRWQNKGLSAIEKPIGTMVASGFWFFTVFVLQFEGQALVALSSIIQVIFSVSVIWAAYRLADVAGEFLTQWSDKTETTLDDHLVPLFIKTLRIFVLVFGSLVMIQNLGFNVMSVLAGLGLGGLAFALAAKDACANLFGSIMILLDRPFAIGDWVVTDGIEGTVEEIGFRSTRIRTFYNSVVSVPNSVIANTNIDNMGLRQYRRVKSILGLTYDTPPEKVEAFMEGVKNIINANPVTRKDYFHVAFTNYNSSSLDIMIYFFLETNDWGVELHERQNIFLEILRLAEKIGVSFAFPSQSLYVESMPNEQDASNGNEINPTELKTNADQFGPNGNMAKPSGLGIFTPAFKEQST